ncbi:hypothetical protein BJX63DRAFT_428251 [Aspergillus granulosus]|uniref:F-box domain-containing protein n=1 Tax=Aspergillus granulosus TaxID=176169 RepID=A0ABR4HZC5_9EURO
MAPFQSLPAELLLLVYKSLTRINDAVSFALTCKKMFALFERREDRAKIIDCIVDNILTSFPSTYPSKIWLEGHFPPGTMFCKPTAAQLPKGLENKETVEFLTTIGFPVFECDRICFESTSTPLVIEKPEKGNCNSNRGTPVPKLRKEELQQSPYEEYEHDDEEENLLFLGTWYSQYIALDPSGSILHQSFEFDDTKEVIAESVGRFLVLLGVIRSVLCDLSDCGLRNYKEEVEEAVLEKLFEGLARADVHVKEAGFWDWVSNYLAV